MPHKFQWLIEKMESANIFDDGRESQYCMVNEYIEEFVISAHMEKPAFHELVTPFMAQLGVAQLPKRRKPDGSPTSICHPSVYRS